MTISSRCVPNEAECPISVELFALMLRADESRVADVLLTLPLVQRAEIAAFRYSRCHMRNPSLLIAKYCDEKSLLAAAGAVGEALLVSFRNSSGFDPEPKAHLRRGITLASFAA